jgi:hypothetical protein
MKILTLVGLLAILSFGCSHDSVGPVPIPAPLTAAEKLAEVNSLAQSFGVGLRLMAVISNNVKPDGTCDLWQYQYVDTLMPPRVHWFHSTSLGVVYDSSSALQVGNAVITGRWFNSDSAMIIAEQNGGLGFRSANPRYTIAAALGQPVVPNATTTWYVTYRATDDSSRLLLLAIDANSGVVTLIPVTTMPGRGQ